ncbi:uncharacterized protein LOC106171698 isoform X1 [Lingula anatina]|uniref:Uncharacterized protein LOC106171698 isoform X1 n=1 Tax=Lingula anatina TaxID=7574 RepID=A0A1S3JB21_LINAN|nr:uncharacterized protein LOC106171698 isoform X1 [Lingula anatina]|eukprot:XP_013407597.1 uncharacterized protein LOC106171698 isoform X1 [Lingula anatina]
MLFHAMKMQCYRSWLCAASLAGARRVRQPPSVRSYIQHISQQKSKETLLGRPLRNYQKRWSMLQSCQAVSHYCTSKQPTEGETVKAQWEPDGATSSTKEAGFSHIPEMPSDADNAIQEQAVMVGENEDGMGEALLASEVEVSNHETAGVKSPTKKKWAANKKSGVPKSSATGTNIKSTLKNHETLLKGIRSKVKTILYQAEGSVDTEAEINDLQEKCDKLFSWLTEENKKIEMKERSTVAMEFLKVLAAFGK